MRSALICKSAPKLRGESWFHILRSRRIRGNSRARLKRKPADPTPLGWIQRDEALYRRGAKAKIKVQIVRFECARIDASKPRRPQKLLPHRPHRLTVRRIASISTNPK